MKSKVLKKIIAVVCAAALMLTAASVVMLASVSASSVAASKTIIDFEDGNAAIISSAGDQPAKILDTSTLSDAKAYWTDISGSYSSMVSGKNQSTWFVLPTGWADSYEAGGVTYARPNEISFDITGSEDSTRAISITSISLVDSSDKETSLTALTKVSTTHNAKITASYKIPVSLDLSSIAKMKMAIWGTNVYVYVDNIRLNYYDSFTAAFTGTETAELASPVADIYQKFTEGETSITLPDATLANGKSFAGWVTEADSATVLPAGTPVALEDDTAFYAVATDRGPYPTPDAPEVTAKTFNSVTLAALGAGFVYSKDGVTWQESNVFTSLEPETRYTFYTKHIATTAYDESAVSAGTTVTTDAITEFVFNSTYVTLSDNTANLGFASNDGYPNISKTGLTAGKGVTLTTKYTVAPGVYDLTLYTRSYAGRAPVDIEVNGTKVAESLDTSKDASGKTGNNLAHALSSITIPETTVLTIKITTTGSGSLYLNSLKLDKTADVVQTPSITMLDGAAMRIDQKTDGIRFSATVPTAQLQALRDSGAKIVDFGMIIAQADSNLTTDSMIVDNAFEMDTESVSLPEEKNAVLASYGRADAESDQSGTVTQIIGSLVEIKPGNANKQYVARAYIKYEYESVEHYIYSNISEPRSIATVAAAVKADTEYYSSLCAKHKEAVDKWLPSTSNVTE
ncbi:MAG: hypothetical protein UH824_03590 [Acutalibacteraceae bacterium]|nr:hypothetical protein [Acutalibacteraceae bacterium]